MNRFYDDENRPGAGRHEGQRELREGTPSHARRSLLLFYAGEIAAIATASDDLTEAEGLAHNLERVVRGNLEPAIADPASTRPDDLRWAYAHWESWALRELGRETVLQICDVVEARSRLIAMASPVGWAGARAIERAMARHFGGYVRRDRRGSRSQ